MEYVGVDDKLLAESGTPSTFLEKLRLEAEKYC